jgi:hypothetical protein
MKSRKLDVTLRYFGFVEEPQELWFHREHCLFEIREPCHLHGNGEVIDHGYTHGAVTFKDSATVLGTGTLISGKATFTTSTLAVGSHSITAVYGGDANFTGSTSPVLTQKVNP